MQGAFSSRASLVYWGDVLPQTFDAAPPLYAMAVSTAISSQP